MSRRVPGIAAHPHTQLDTWVPDVGRLSLKHSRWWWLARWSATVRYWMLSAPRRAPNGALWRLKFRVWQEAIEAERSADIRRFMSERNWPGWVSR